ncbi:MAG: T9SS type A sorting domain-containing protein [Bacteroidota bacterium]
MPSPFVDVAGYAEGVVGLSGEANGAYTTLDGTAPAAAVVGGVAGLLKAEKPDLTGEEIEGILRLTATDAGTAGFDEATGAGTVDAGEALRYVRDNEFARETASGVEVLTDDIHFTDLVELQGFCRYYSGSGYCTLVTGKLRRFTARVDFPNSISPSSAPDVFVRWAESDGTDNTWWFNSNNWYTRYDPFVKSLSITSVDAEGFDIEGYYWDASFYNSASQRLAQGAVPDDPEDFEVAYTAAASQLVVPPPSFRVSMTGPYAVPPRQARTWRATAMHGTPPYTYRWRVREPCPYDPPPCSGVCLMGPPICDYEDAGSGRSMTRSFSETGQALVRVTVTDATNAIRFSERTVTVGSGRPAGSESDDLSTASRASVPPSEVRLSAYPNPLASAASVRFGLPERADVALAVYDVLGREVARLVSGPAEAGWHMAAFDASALPSGVYVVRLAAGSAVRTERVTVTR